MEREDRIVGPGRRQLDFVRDESEERTHPAGEILARRKVDFAELRFDGLVGRVVRCGGLEKARLRCAEGQLDPLREAPRAEAIGDLVEAVDRAGPDRLPGTLVAPCRHFEAIGLEMFREDPLPASRIGDLHPQSARSPVPADRDAHFHLPELIAIRGEERGFQDECFPQQSGGAHSDKNRSNPENPRIHP